MVGMTRLVWGLMRIYTGTKMARKKDKKTTGSINPAGRVRIAYTLNNKQPVICSIVGDEPLFYMDHEYSDDTDMSQIIEGLEQFTGHVDAATRLSAASIATARSSEDLFCASSDDMLGDQIAQYISAQDAVALVHKSAYGRALLEAAQETGTRIIDSVQTDSVFYDRHAGLILVHPSLDMAEKILLIARELRRAWQHRAGALVNPLLFHPDHAILVNRILTADLSISMVRVAWDLHLQAIQAPWIRLEASSMADLASGFSRIALADFRSLNNGDAFWSCFEAWFLSDRCRKCDRQIIQQMLADYSGYVFGGSEETSRMLTTQIMAALGSQPLGKNYLSGQVGRILDDQIFTDVRDRANANFLWFIKFEQSFRAAEQELQVGMKGPSGLSHSPSLGHNNDDTVQKGILVTLPVRPRTAEKVGTGQATILDFNVFRKRQH